MTKPINDHKDAIRDFVFTESEKVENYMKALKRGLDSMESNSINVSLRPPFHETIHGGFLPGCYYTKEDFVREIVRVRDIFIYMRHLPWEEKNDKTN